MTVLFDNITVMFDIWFTVYNIWASSQQNLSSGFPTKLDSNQSPHLPRLAREFEISPVASLYGNFQKANNKGADQSAQMRMLVCAFVVRQPLEDRFSHVEAHIVHGFDEIKCEKLLHCKSFAHFFYQKAYLITTSIHIITAIVTKNPQFLKF